MLNNLLMLAPQPNQTIVCTSGDVYTANGDGIIKNIQTLADQLDLSGAGCVTLTPPPNNLLFKLTGANFNSTADQPLILWSNAKYRIRRITALNTSVNGMGTAAGGLYTGAGKTGTTIVAAGQVYTGLTNPATALDLTLNVPNAVLVAGTPLFFALTTGQGAPATADIYVFGDTFS